MMIRLAFVSLVILLAGCGSSGQKKEKVEATMPVPVHQIIRDLDSLPFNAFLVMHKMEDMYKDRYDTIKVAEFMKSENAGKSLFSVGVQPFKNRSHLYQLFSNCIEGKTYTAEFQWHRGMYLMVAPLDTIECVSDYQSYLAN